MDHSMVQALLSQSLWDWRAVLSTLTLPFLLTLLITTWNSFKGPASKRPPTVPYAIPYLGHTLSFGTNGSGFLLKNKMRFGASMFKMVIPSLTEYIASGPRSVAKVFRAEGMSMTADQITAMERSFGLPERAGELYRSDDSGYGQYPVSGSKVDPGDRIIYEIHNVINRNLSGDPLTGITSQFQRFFAEELSSLDHIGSEWVDVPDLADFMRVHVMKAAIKAMFGPYLLSLNPTFIEDFWSWNAEMGPLFMGIPRWLVPSAYKKREKMLQSIMRWHEYAHQHYNCHKIAEEDPEWEPYFGSKFSRKRQSLFSRWEAMDARARAADDMSFIWAGNANSVNGALWFLLELLMDRELLARVRKEFDAAAIPAVQPSEVATVDVNKVCGGALCQSIFAEVLRLKVGVLVSRTALRDLDFQGWSVKTGERVAVSSTLEAMDETIWNTGTATDPHPLDRFWADRFLVYPNDPNSGPLKRRSAGREADAGPKAEDGPQAESVADDSGWPRFSMKGVTTNWIPFSGGARYCPGRHFAKQEMISVAAIMTTALDIELTTAPGWKPEDDMNYYGFGTVPPKGKIPCRMRRRQRAVQ